MNRLRSLLVLTAFAFAPSLALAGPITYNFSQSLTQDANDYFSVAGTLTTDGTLGTVTSANITSYDLFLTITSNSQTQSVELSTVLANGNRSIFGNDSFNASASILSFDFSQGSFVQFGGYGAGYLELDPNSESAFHGGLTVIARESGVQTIATAVSTAPEPSSLVLLATGALGMAGVARKRFLRYAVPSAHLFLPA